MQTRQVMQRLAALAALCGCAGIPIPAGGTSTSTGGGGTVTPASGNVAADVVAFTNDARARNGLPRLATNAKLTEAASIQARQLAQFQVVEHTISGAQYPTLQSRLQAAGYAYSNAAENIAWNQRDPQEVVTTWMNSSGHRANILDPELREIGAAMARSSKGEPYWVQVFGTPR